MDAKLNIYKKQIVICRNLCLGVNKVPRAAASAVAFGAGLFSGKGTLGPGKHRAFSVVSESRASDILLRFFDTCATYKVCI
jgi:hypothetical protein